MPQSLVHNYIHLVFSTKNREQFMIPQFEDRIYDYLGGICNELECQPLKIGGHLDHVHLLFKLSQNIALSKFVQKLKSNSSKWVKSINPLFKNFYWQDGYGAFSVTSTEIEKVILYIENQKIHHSSISFQNEFRTILKRYKVKYDEKYVWD